MGKTAASKYADKDLIVFDLDGTLTPSKSNMEPDMSRVLTALLSRKKVAVIGGGTWAQFRRQFLGSLRCPKKLLPDLFLFPTTATAFYRYRNGWKKVYAHTLSQGQKRDIKDAINAASAEIHYVPPRKIYGKTLEDRGSQMSYSFLGQDVVARLGKKGIALKEKWRRENTPIKLKMARLLAKRLPQLEVHAAGFTTIDITRRGVNKAYGVRKIEKYLRIPIRKMIFIGDALFRGGNDAAAKRTGVDCIAVRGPKDTERIIKRILKKG